MRASGVILSPDMSEDSADEASGEAPAHADWIGRVIEDRYRIEALLAEGGMGAVFEATHLRMDRRVALKIVHPDHMDNRVVVQRFQREVKAHGRLDHPNVVAALDCGRTKTGEAYLVTQLAQGENLADVLEVGALGWRRACELGAEIADALHAAHQAGVVHRDLKPSNVILVPDDDGVEHARLIDFGIARFMDEEEAASPKAEGRSLTEIGTAVGTVGYMAPEQGLGQPVDARTDLYALGVLIFEMVTGEPLFDRRSLTMTTYITRQLTEDPPRLGERVEGVPDGLSALVEQLLQGKRAERLDDAREVRERLRELAVWVEPEPAETVTEETEAVALPSAASEAPSSARPIRPRLPRARARGAEPLLERVRARPWGFAIAVTVVAVVGIVWLAVGGDEGPGKPPKAEQAAPAAPVSPAPAPMQAELAQLLADEVDWRARREAARAIWDFTPREALDPLTLNLARLQLVADCDARRRTIRDLAELGDPRALGPLARHRRNRRDRCRLQDEFMQAERTLRAP